MVPIVEAPSITLNLHVVGLMVSTVSPFRIDCLIQKLVDAKRWQKVKMCSVLPPLYKLWLQLPNKSVHMEKKIWP